MEMEEIIPNNEPTFRAFSGNSPLTLSTISLGVQGAGFPDSGF